MLGEYALDRHPAGAASTSTFSSQMRSPEIVRDLHRVRV
jgi:hypothetical protein